MVGAFREPSCGRRTQPIHSIPYSVAQPLERGSNNYYSIIQGNVNMSFFTNAIDVLQTLVIALGGGLCVWGGINLLEGYGQDNPASNAYVS